LPGLVGTWVFWVAASGRWFVVSGTAGCRGRPAASCEPAAGG